VNLRRDRSVVTGTSAASLNPDLVTRIEWWLHDRFEEREFLQAAELIAFDELDSALRSRGIITAGAEALAERKDVDQMVRSMLKEPTGSVDVPTLSEALSAIERLEERIDALEKEIEELRDRA
jgi:hypothetical protein